MNSLEVKNIIKILEDLGKKQYLKLREINETWYLAIEKNENIDFIRIDTNIRHELFELEDLGYISFSRVNQKIEKQCSKEEIFDLISWYKLS